MFFCLTFVVNALQAQTLVGTRAIPSTNFPSIKVAIDSMNLQGVGTGGVTFNITAGYVETLLAPLVITATGTATNPIVFQKSGIGPNPLITSFTGVQLASSTTAIDIMWSLVGSDFVTINGIDLQDDVANTTPTTQMEVGYGIYKASATDGANNNTIQNCTITLNRNNITAAAAGPRANATGSVGIEVVNALNTAVGTAITVTSVSGASSNNKFYGNTIQNVSFGILLSGFAAPSPYTLADLNNDIGGIVPSTGNNIINFGGGAGGTAQCGAVLINNQWSFNISHNTVNNNTGVGVNHGGSNRGIWLFNSSAGASCNINFNKITINGGPSTTAIDWCLDLEMATTGANGNIININNNQFLNCNKTNASTAAFTACWINTAASTVNVLNNYFYGFTYAGTGTSQVILSQLASGTLNINNNTIDSTVLTGPAATGTHHNIGITTAPLLALNINSNTVTRTYLNTSGTGTKILYPIYCSAATPTININDNLVDSVTRNGTTGGTTIGIYHLGGTNGVTTVNCRRNTVRNMSISGTGATSTMYGIQLSTGTIICDSNVITNLLCAKITGVSALYGIYDISSPNNETFSNNRISNLTHSGTGLVYGIYAFTTTGTRLVTGNTINALTGNGGNVIGILMSSSSPTITRNKIYSLRSNGSTTGTVFGISITSLATAGSATVANNLIDSLVAPNYSGATDAIRGISSIITLATTNLRIYYNTIHLNATSIGANFSTSNVFFTGGVTATTATLDLRNNILVNNSVANGTGNVAALRNATTGIANYANTSNNNLFFAGIPSSMNLIYADGTNIDSTISSFKTRLGTFEQSSFTENPTFISFDGASPNYLHLDLTTPTQCESGGVNVAGFTTDFDNVIRQGNAGYVGTGTAPDVGADEGQFIGIPMVLDSIMVDQITAAVPLNSVNQQVVAIRVHTSNSFNAFNLSSLRLNTIGTTNVNDIQNAKVFFTGNSPVFNTNAQYGSTVVAPNGLFTISGSRQLASGVNYFWVTYDTKSTATPNNLIDVRVDSLVLGGMSYAPVNGNPAGSRRILAPLIGTFNVGVGQTYPTITAAAGDLGALGVSGPVTFILKDLLYNVASGEIFPIVFNNYIGSSAVNIVTIRPDSGIASRIESANAIATIDLNGVNNLTIDGRQGGVGGFASGNNLTIANTSNNGPAIRLINEASSNRILYTDIRSNNMIVPGTIGAGVVNFGTTSGANGNDANIIRFCDIHEDALGNPTIGISSIGSVTSVAANNDANIIDSCNIYNFFHPTIATAGIYVGANNGSWTINANRFYQTATVTTTGTQTHRVMWITPNVASLTSASGFVITNNFIGGNSAAGTGVYTMTGTSLYQFFGMDISVGIGTASSVQNNTLTNFAITGGFTGNNVYGINIANGNVNVGTITGNLIGSTTVNGAITFTTTAANGSMIALRSGAGGTINFSNNTVSGIDLIGNATNISCGFNGIAGSGGANIIVHNNTIGSTTLANSINGVSTSATATLASAFRGIICNSGTAGVVNTVTNNIVSNINLNYAATGAQATTLVGIAVSTGTSTVSGNIIRNLTTATQTTAGVPNAAVAGIAYSSTTAPVVITGNTISSLVLTGTSTTAAVQAVGISFSGPSTGTNLITRNSVHSLSLNANNPAAFISGFDISGGIANVQNNMIRLGYDSMGVDIVSSSTFRGITKFAGSFNLYFNSVFIGGNGVVAGASNTFAFARNSTGIEIVRNNIFVNNRSNALGTGKHYQVFLSNATTLTMNNNMYFGNGTGAVFGTLNSGTNDVLNYTSGWVATDLNSGVSNPQFINAVGSAQTVDLHISASIPTPIESGGAAIAGITDDFDGQTRTGLTPTDIGADAGNFVVLDIFAPTFVTPNVSNSSSTADRIFNTTITDISGVPSTTGNQPRVYFKKFMAGTFQSTGAIRTSGTAQNGQWSFTISQSAMGGLSVGDSVYFYLVAQDSSSTSNLSSLPAGVVGTNVNTIVSAPNTLFAYRIVPGLSGTINVGVGQTYTSLTGVGGFFEAVNNSSLNSNVTAVITSDLFEDGTNGLNQINETGTGNYTISIVPDTTTERLIVGSFAGGLIRFNGSDRVRIDGRFAGAGRFLRFRNRLLNGHTITFQNDAIRDTVTSCHIESVNNTVGTITFLGTNGTIGNDSNAIINCVIRDTLSTIASSNIPNTALQSAGTAGIGNDYNTFANNEVLNFGFAVANLGINAGDFWNISNNSIYQTISKGNVIIALQIDGGTGHIINGNSMGGSNVNRSGPAFTTTSATNPNMIAVRINNAVTTAQITNNTFSNIASGRGVNLITVSAGNVAIANNTFGGGAMPYDTIMNGFDNGIITVSGGIVSITNNLIGNVNYYLTGGDRTSGITISGGTVNATGNTIRDIRSSTTGTAFTFLPTGIQISGGINHNIESNTIFNIVNTNTGAAAYTVAGITITGSTTPIIQRNRIYNVWGNGTGLGASSNQVFGIYNATTLNATVRNNQISIGNNTIGETRVYGIQDVAGSGNNSYFNNTIFLNGIITSGSNNSYCLHRTGLVNISSFNNIFYNKRRTLGTGSNYATGSNSLTGIAPSTTNYNLYVVNDTNRVAESPLGIANSINGFNSLYTGVNTYSSNWYEVTNNLLAQNLFIDTLIGNLGIVTTQQSSWYAHGKGLPLANVTNDFNNAPRSVTIAAGATDIGSVEFTTTTTPIAATPMTLPALNTTTNYTFANRVVASVNWASIGTVPTALNVLYYSGTNAPSLNAGSTRYNSYYNIVPTGGTGYNFGISLLADSALLGNVSGMVNTRLARFAGTTWALLASSNGNGITGTMQTTLNTQNTFGVFTGTDNVNNPLPVQLLQFTATQSNQDVLLKWSTAMELNNEGFDIQRSLDSETFETIGFAKGKQNSNSLSQYQFNDSKPFELNKVSRFFYRLKQIDLNGDHAYSNIVEVSDRSEETISLYPNPMLDHVNLGIKADHTTTVRIEVYSVQGYQLMRFEKEIEKGYQQFPLHELENMSAGVYLVVVNIDGRSITHKLIKM